MCSDCVQNTYRKKKCFNTKIKTDVAFSVLQIRNIPSDNNDSEIKKNCGYVQEPIVQTERNKKQGRGSITDHLTRVDCKHSSYAIV